MMHGKNRDEIHNNASKSKGRKFRDKAHVEYSRKKFMNHAFEWDVRWAIHTFEIVNAYYATFDLLN